MRGRQSERPIVVGIDGSEQALRAARWGAAEAESRGLPLRLVSAFDWMPDELGKPAAIYERYRDDLLERTEIGLRTAAGVVGRENTVVAIDHQVMAGSPCAVLCCESRSAHVVVVGGHGSGRIDGTAAGSVTVMLAAHAVCPVVVVRGARRTPFKAASLPVVVGVDGSPASDEAVAFAFEAAATRGARLIAAHASMIGRFVTRSLDRSAVVPEERQLLIERLTWWEDKYPDVPTECVIAQGNPARSLLEQASTAQLLVVGKHERCDLGVPVLGSVGTAIVHRAACPVAFVGARTEGGPDAT